MGWGWAGGGGGCSCKVTEWWGVLRWFGKVSFLVCSVVVTLTAMTLCIVSSIVSLLQLKVAMNTPLNVNKAIKVDKYEPPAILILGNGIQLYECLFSQFRHNVKATDEDPETTYNTFDYLQLLIDEDCDARPVEFVLTLEDLNNHPEALSSFTDWVQKNLITTIDTSRCDESSTDESSRRHRRSNQKGNESLASTKVSQHPRRKKRGVDESLATSSTTSPLHPPLLRGKRDSFDDKAECGGECGFLWDCSNQPDGCASKVAVFDNCFNPHTPYVTEEPCLTVYSCLSGNVVLPNQCGHYINCMTLESIHEQECVDVADCFHHLNRTLDNCHSVFQCLEDQIEHKCEDPLTTTDVPMNLSEDELDDVCAGLDRILADDPSLEGQKNEPLSIILFKGPTEYATRDFAFTSIRLGEAERGAWVAMHPSFSEVAALLESSEKLDFLLFAIETLRWTFAARFSKSIHFISRYDAKVEGVLQESQIKAESVLSRLNESSPFLLDFRPIEVLLQWKDGYVITNNKFIGVTVWDAFAIVANTLLMLERAWLTWGRLSKKLVNTKAQIYLEKYKEGSPEYKLIKSILERSSNVLSALWAFNKIKKVTRNIERLANKRKLVEDQERKREEKRKRRMMTKIALKYNIWLEEVQDLEAQRFEEWSILRKMMKGGDLEDAQWKQHLFQSEQDKMNALLEHIEAKNDRQTSGVSRRSRSHGPRSKSGRGSRQIPSPGSLNTTSSRRNSPDVDDNEPLVSMASRVKAADTRKLCSRRVNAAFQLQDAVDSRQHESDNPNSSASDIDRERNPWSKRKVSRGPPNLPGQATDSGGGTKNEVLAEYEDWVKEWNQKSHGEIVK
ncbi:uncharacterized protein LOC134841788 [Symsagittifera roscoffensis]|uniref:uncharacterized protein LOC134841788 n=1 Tax=Symsagittifera roscoffensis TaxID=84072 RepID=UPI00307BBEEF